MAFRLPACPPTRRSPAGPSMACGHQGRAMLCPSWRPSHCGRGGQRPPEPETLHLWSSGKDPRNPTLAGSPRLADNGHVRDEGRTDGHPALGHRPPSWAQGRPLGARPDQGGGHPEGSRVGPPDSPTRGGRTALPCGLLGREPTPGWTLLPLLSSRGRPRPSRQHPTPPPCLLQNQVQKTKWGSSRASAHSTCSTPGQRVPRREREDGARPHVPEGNVPGITSHFSSKN